MWFPAALVSTTLITIISIVAVYKIFLDKPDFSGGVKLPSATISSIKSATPDPSLAPHNPWQQSSNSPTPKTSPSPSASRRTTSAITVLENLTSANPSASPASSAASSTISGTISFSGTAPSGSSIVIVARANGTSDQYQTILNGISASNTSWSWSGATSGKSYDMIAILKGSSGGVNTDYAYSQTYVVNAPASNQIFSVNAGSSLSAPTGAITTYCYSKNSNNTWYVDVRFTNSSGAQAYWLQVGTTSGAYDLANVKQNAKSGDYQTVNLTLNDSQIYYARYAAASVPDPTSVQYSSFSSVSNIKCP